jgi:hypothetical protein
MVRTIVLVALYQQVHGVVARELEMSSMMALTTLQQQQLPMDENVPVIDDFCLGMMYYAKE